MRKQVCKRGHPLVGLLPRPCQLCKRYTAREWQRRQHAIINEAKNGPCADCGNKYPPHVMDFDHPPNTKEFGVSGRWVSKARLLAEIAKCDLVCANCHRERTYWRHENRQLAA